MTTLQPLGTMDKRKKWKIHTIMEQTISESNIAKLKEGKR